LMYLLEKDISPSEFKSIFESNLRGELTPN